MEKYTFYIISNDYYIKGLTLKKAIEKFNIMHPIYKNGYIAIGVNKENDSIDILCSFEGVLKISNDYLYTSFKNDNIIKNNVINILKDTFKL